MSQIFSKDSLSQIKTFIKTTTSQGLVERGGEFKGSGRPKIKLTLQEEMKVVEHVKWRASIGHGLDWHMLGLLLQELFQALKLANPARVTDLEDVGQLPTPTWIRCFAERIYDFQIPRTTLREDPWNDKCCSNGFCPNRFSTPPPSSNRTRWGYFFRRKLVNFLKQRF